MWNVAISLKGEVFALTFFSAPAFGRLWRSRFSGDSAWARQTTVPAFKQAACQFLVLFKLLTKQDTNPNKSTRYTRYWR